MLGIGRQAIGTEADSFLMPELLGGDLVMAVVAEVAGVVVLVAATESQRLDVVDDGSELHAVTIMAQLAEASRPSHASLPLTLACSTTEARGGRRCGHMTTSRSRYQESR